MPAVNDIIQIKDFQSMTGHADPVMNVYYFRVTNVTGAPVINNMGDAFDDAWFVNYIQPIRAIQSANLSHVRIEVNNLMAYSTEFLVRAPDVAAPGLVASPFNTFAASWSFRLVRLLRTTRNGSKRIPGVPESYVDNNLVTGLGIAAVADVATRLGEALEVSDGTNEINMIPVIVRLATPVPTTPPAATNNVLEAIYRGVSTQNTRKQLL